MKKSLFSVILFCAASAVFSVTAFAEKKIDYDLTRMNAYVSYATVFSFVVQPATYQGKIVKMKGVTKSVVDEASGKKRYYILVSDPSACCVSGLEYIKKDSVYAEDDAVITITGKFYYKQDKTAKSDIIRLEDCE